MKGRHYYFTISVTLLILGIVLVGYSFLVYPTLIPYYGGGEAIILDKNNDFTNSFFFQPKTSLLIEINLDNPVHLILNNIEINYDESVVHVLEPDKSYLMRLVGEVHTEGYMKLRQALPTSMKVISISILAVGIIMIMGKFISNSRVKNEKFLHEHLIFNH